MDARAGAGRAGIAQRLAGGAVGHPRLPYSGPTATRTGLRRQRLAAQRTERRRSIILIRLIDAGVHQPSIPIAPTPPTVAPPTSRHPALAARKPAGKHGETRQTCPP